MRGALDGAWLADAQRRARMSPSGCSAGRVGPLGRPPRRQRRRAGGHRPADGRRRQQPPRPIRPRRARESARLRRADASRCSGSDPGRCCRRGVSRSGRVPSSRPASSLALAERTLALRRRPRQPLWRSAPPLDSMASRGGRSSAGRAPGCGPGGRGFESPRSPLEEPRIWALYCLRTRDRWCRQNPSWLS